MKSLLHNVKWWPGIDYDIESTINKYSKCQLVYPALPAAPLQPWVWPPWPWSHLHLVFNGPFLSYMFVVIIDAHAKWLEVIPLPGAISELTIQQLLTIFVYCQRQ